MNSKYVNVYCPRSLCVYQFFYYPVTIGNEKKPFPAGCNFCEPEKTICQHCTDSVLKILLACLSSGKAVPNPIRTNIELFSDHLEDSDL